LFGFLPAPYAYGAIFTSTKATDPKLALSLVFYYVSVGTVLIFIGMMIRYKDFRDKELVEREFQLNFEKNKIIEEEEKVRRGVEGKNNKRSDFGKADGIEMMGKPIDGKDVEVKVEIVVSLLLIIL